MNNTEASSSKSHCIKTYLRALRAHQYAKNILIFIPWLLAHQMMALPGLLNCCFAFISFSLLASSGYLLNDLIDLPSDRQHRTKKHRPLASGALSIRQGVVLFCVCFVTAWPIAMAVGSTFSLALACYFLLTILYSLYFKKLLLIDILLLSLLYTIRLIAGTIAAGVAYSEWLLLFSLFIFTSLAFLKRYTELYFAKKDNVKLLKGRGYHVTQISAIKMFGIVSGYISILVFALYVNSAKAISLYQHYELLYLTCPLLIYWISRLWLIAADGKMHEDPVAFAIKDKASFVVVILIILTGIFASL